MASAAVPASAMILRVKQNTSKPNRVTHACSWSIKRGDDKGPKERDWCLKMAPLSDWPRRTLSTFFPRCNCLFGSKGYAVSIVWCVVIFGNAPRRAEDTPMGAGFPPGATAPKQAVRWRSTRQARLNAFFVRCEVCPL